MSSKYVENDNKARFFLHFFSAICAQLISDKQSLIEAKFVERFEVDSIRLPPIRYGKPSSVVGDAMIHILYMRLREVNILWEYIERKRRNQNETHWSF